MGPVDGMRDYQAWHRAYDDPTSDLSWRLDQVQSHLRRAMDRHPGRIRILSSCAGDGRDVLDVLAGRADAGRASVTLLEIHPELAAQARQRAAAAGVPQVEVRTVDAGHSDAYVGAVPADIVLLVGILGNLSDAHVSATIAAGPQLCAPGATLLWSRGREESDHNEAVRRSFRAAGFTELDYDEHGGERGAALGALRYDGEPQVLIAGQEWFTFLR